MDDFKNIFTRAKAAAQDLLALGDERRVQILNAVAGATLAHQEELLRANAEDLSRMDPQNPLYDRLALSPERLEGIAADMRQVAALPTPLDRILEERTMPNGLRVRKISVPFGVVGVVYEARPNVTFDVFSLCFKSGSVCLLKGGRDADRSNQYAVSLIRGVLERFDVNPDAVILLPATREAVHALLTASEWVDLVIPRGGRGLIDFVREHAKVPTIETGAGVVNTYFDKNADLEIGKAIVYNAKTRRPGVCNALDCLLIHQDRLKDLQALCLPLLDHRVELFVDEAALAALDGAYPADLLHPAGPNTFGTEFLSFKMGIRTVASLDEALAHIHEYGSGHSESIVTEDPAVADRFRRQVDAACVYVNAPTSFTDGAQFGLGAEIGISTQKLGARGPMGLREITTYKWLIDGRGQMRP